VLETNMLKNAKNAPWKHDHNVKKCCSKEFLTLSPAKSNENVAKGHCKKVYCVELDRVFESAKLASIQLGVSDSNIAKCCKGKNKTTGGYHWKYATKEEAEAKLKEMKEDG
jgi:hypothetical protein